MSPPLKAALLDTDILRSASIGDADILIAATALEHGLIVVTNYQKHYQRVNGIELENWLA